jgi:predicted lactoylglutathione lyase
MTSLPCFAFSDSLCGEYRDGQQIYACIHSLWFALILSALHSSEKEYTMIGYVTLGTNDMEKAARFYDALLSELGAKRLMDMGTFIAWGTGPGQPMLAITKPFDGNKATIGNGVMVALGTDSRAKVDAVYKKAMELGAKDEGPVGPRGEGFYAGYFRDPDGNKLNAFCMG